MVTRFLDVRGSREMSIGVGLWVGVGYTKVTDMITEVYRFQLKTLRGHTLVITETVDHDYYFHLQEM